MTSNETESATGTSAYMLLDKKKAKNRFKKKKGDRQSPLLPSASAAAAAASSSSKRDDLIEMHTHKLTESDDYSPDSERKERRRRRRPTRRDRDSDDDSSDDDEMDHPDNYQQGLAGGRGKSTLARRVKYDPYKEWQARHGGNLDSDEYSDTFLRKTVKFWVLPSNFIKVKKRVLKQLPEWRFDGKKSATLAESGSVSSSVYFDTHKMDLYNTRILQIEDSMLFRYRWYSGKKATKGFMEQKLRQPKWRCLPSIKQRFQLLPMDVPAYLATGQASLNEPLVRDIYGHMLKWDRLSHAIRSTYRRSVFQESNGADVRVSFDEDIELTDVSQLTWEEATDPSVSVKHHRIFHFPLGVLEVKLAFKSFDEVSSLELPPWVLQMQAQGMIIEVEKFSKYCTGAAVMNLHAIKRVPSWIAAVKSLMEVELAKKGQGMVWNRTRPAMGNCRSKRCNDPCPSGAPRAFSK